MKTKNIIIILIVTAVVAGIYYSFTGNETSEAYIAKIEQLRKEKDNSIQGGDDSPFGDSIEFNGLKYFPIDAKYRINARLTEIDQKKPLSLPTSDGKQKSYLEYAYAEFELDGVNSKLLILEIMDMGPYRGTLFLAFADKTSADETYGAGRYLDIKKLPGATSITLDFNEAYNPYCAYNDNYSCPFPPKENMLEVAIKAGEKTYH
jgi:uncharacterized protein (DUF1684 family)